MGFIRIYVNKSTRTQRWTVGRGGRIAEQLRSHLLTVLRPDIEIDFNVLCGCKFHCSRRKSFCKSDYHAKGVLYLPVETRSLTLVTLLEGAKTGSAEELKLHLNER